MDSLKNLSEVAIRKREVSSWFLDACRIRRGAKAVGGGLGTNFLDFEMSMRVEMGSRESASTLRKISKSSGQVELRRYLQDEGISFVGSELSERGEHRPVPVPNDPEESPT